MPLPLLIVNVVVLLFAFLLLMSLNNRFRLLFLAGAILPAIFCIVVAYFAFGANTWGLEEYVMLLLRGVFALAVLTGGALCYFVSQKPPKD